jgi:hypothetical protein
LPFFRQFVGKPRNRSLSAPLAHIEGSAYLGPRKPFTPERSHPVSVDHGAGPSEFLPLGASIAQTSPNTLLDERSLELCHGSDYLEHESARRRAEIEIVAEADKCNAIGAKVRESVDQMLQRVWTDPRHFRLLRWKSTFSSSIKFSSYGAVPKMCPTG